MDRTEFNSLIQKAKDAGLHGVGYPKTWLINATDSDGTVQSYYASTGTAIFRDGNDDRYHRAKKKTFRNFPYDRFIALCVGDGDDDILDFFKEE